MHECPDKQSWQLFLDGSTSEAERSAAESHLVRCSICRARLIELHDQVQETVATESAPWSLQQRVSQSPAPASATPRLKGTRGLYLPLTLAASILIAVGLSVYVLRFNQPGPGARGVTDVRQSQDSTPDLRLTNPLNHAQLGGTVEFRWAEAGPGARYQLTLTDEKGDIVYEGKPAANFLVLDISTLNLTLGKSYYWSVSARQPDGTTRESNIARFTLR